MKKLLLAIALITSQLLLAQDTIPNAGFERWTPTLFTPGAYDPNGGNGTIGWWDFNFDNSKTFFNDPSPQTVLRDSTKAVMAEQGKYCAEIVSQEMTKDVWDTLNKYGFFYPQINGILFAGNVTLSFTGASYKQGIPFTMKMKAFYFYYQYVPNGADSAICTIAMTHFNTNTKKSDIIGGGRWGIASKVTTWTKDSVGIYYDSAGITPDTAIIVFSACSLTKPLTLDTLWLDNTGVELPAGINEVARNSSNVKIYPNPAKSEINLSISGASANRLDIFDITGNRVESFPVMNNYLTINTQSYSSGLYLYQLYNKSGVILNTGKFSIVK